MKVLGNLVLLFAPLLLLGALTLLFVYTVGTAPETLPQPVLDGARWIYTSTHSAPTAATEAGNTVVGIASAIGLGAFLITLYFLPAIVGRKRRNAAAIFLLNLLLGWTLLGWVVALVWAATTDQPSSSSTNTTSSPTPIP